MPDDDLTLLRLRAIRIVEDSGEWVRKDRSRFGEGNTMLPQVGGLFGRMPFEDDAQLETRYHGQRVIGVDAEIMYYFRARVG